MNSKQLANKALVQAAIYIKAYCTDNFVCQDCPLEYTGICDKAIQPAGWNIKGVQDGTEGKE